MKKLAGFLLALSFFIPFNAQSVEVVREGPLVVVRASCLAVNLDKLNEKIPQGVTTLRDLLGIYLLSLRNLTPEEVALCTGNPVTIPIWRVAENGSSLTRPVYLLNMEGQGPPTKIPTKIRASIGEPCENAVPTYSSPSRGNKEWRFLAGQTEYVVLCEYK